MPQIINVSAYDPKERHRAGQAYSEQNVSALRANGAVALIARAGKGGVLVAGPGWEKPPEGEDEFSEKEMGAGTLILSRQEAAEPESLAREMTEWIGAAKLPVRLFNASSALVEIWKVGSGDLLVHVVNYATAASDRITVRAHGDYSRARLYRPGIPAVDAAIEKTANGTEARIDEAEVAASLLFMK